MAEYYSSVISLHLIYDQGRYSPFIGSMHVVCEAVKVKFNLG